MDNLSGILENNELMKRSQTDLSLMQPDSELPTASYLDQMLVIVSDSFELSAQNPTTAEKVSRAETWSRHLFGIIPESRLEETFKRAFEIHERGFPVSAYDLNDAWNLIQVEDERKRQQEQDAIRESRPVEHCKMKLHHENELGERLIVVGGFGGVEHLIPCEFCRPTAHAQKMKILMERIAA